MDPRMAYGYGDRRAQREALEAMERMNKKRIECASCGMVVEDTAVHVCPMHAFMDKRRKDKRDEQGRRDEDR